MDEFTAFEASGWDRKAGGYQRLVGRLTGRMAGPLLDAVALVPGERVLDVGCGAGYGTALAADRGAVAVGVDASTVMIDLARHRPAGPGAVPTFLVATADQLPFAARSFDVVVANFLIHHLADPDLVLAEFRRVLRPGGRVALAGWDSPKSARLIGVLLDAMDDVGAAAPPGVPAGPPFFAHSAEDQLAVLLHRAGFADVRRSRVTFDHTIRDADEWWRGLMDGTVRISALVAGQPEPVRRRIRAAFDRRVSAYLEGDHVTIPAAARLATGVNGLI